MQTSPEMGGVGVRKSRQAAGRVSVAEDILHEKLEHLRVAAAITADPVTAFELKKRIEETENEIARITRRALDLADPPEGSEGAANPARNEGPAARRSVRAPTRIVAPILILILALAAGILLWFSPWLPSPFDACIILTNGERYAGRVVLDTWPEFSPSGLTFKDTTFPFKDTTFPLSGLDSICFAVENGKGVVTVTPRNEVPQRQGSVPGFMVEREVAFHGSFHRNYPIGDVRCIKWQSVCSNASHN